MQAKGNILDEYTEDDDFIAQESDEDCMGVYDVDEYLALAERTIESLKEGQLNIEDQLSVVTAVTSGLENYLKPSEDFNLSTVQESAIQTFNDNGNNFIHDFWKETTSSSEETPVPVFATGPMNYLPKSEPKLQSSYEESAIDISSSEETQNEFFPKYMFHTNKTTSPVKESTKAMLVGLQNCPNESDSSKETCQEFVIGYQNCLNEAVRYLVDEEHFPINHPTVEGLKQHLLTYENLILQYYRLFWKGENITLDSTSVQNPLQTAYHVPSPAVYTSIDKLIENTVPLIDSIFSL